MVAMILLSYKYFVIQLVYFHWSVSLQYYEIVKCMCLELPSPQ